MPATASTPTLNSERKVFKAFGIGHAAGLRHGDLVFSIERHHEGPVKAVGAQRNLRLVGGFGGGVVAKDVLVHAMTNVRRGVCAAAQFGRIWPEGLADGANLNAKPHVVGRFHAFLLLLLLYRRWRHRWRWGRRWIVFCSGGEVGVAEGPVHGRRHVGLAVFGSKKVLFVWVGQEPEFHQRARHGRVGNDVEPGLLHAAVFPPNPLPELGLDGGAQSEAGVEVDVLAQREGDVRVRVVGVKAVVVPFVAFLAEHGGILAHGHAQALFRFMHAHHIRPSPPGPRVVEGVAMNGDEEVGLGVVGDAHPVTKSRKAVVLAGVNHLDLGEVFFDVLADSERDVERDVLFRRAVAPRPEVARVLAAVSSIQNHREGRWGRGKRRAQGYQGNAPCNHALFGYF